MTISTRLPWATDDNFAAGGDAWSGDPNKVEPSAARTEEGWPPNVEPAASHFNYLVNKIGLLIDANANMAIRNWFPMEVAGTPLAGLARAGVYVPANEGFAFIDNYGEVSASFWDFSATELYGNKGALFEVAEDAAGDCGWNAAAATSVDMAVVPGSTQRIAVSNAGDVADQIGQLDDLGGTWAATGTAGTNVWLKCAANADYVIIGGVGGVIGYTPSSMAYGWNVSTPFSDAITALEGNGLSGADALFLASSTVGAETGWSVTGQTWQVNALVGCSILDFCYSPATGWWMWVDALGRVRRSATGKSFGDQIYLPYRTEVGTLTAANMSANDDQGIVIAGYNSATGKTFLWASVDDGATFEAISFNNSIGAGWALAYGGNRFIVHGAGNVFGTLIGAY